MTGIPERESAHKPKRDFDIWLFEHADLLSPEGGQLVAAVVNDCRFPARPSLHELVRHMLAAGYQASQLRMALRLYMLFEGTVSMRRAA